MIYLLLLLSISVNGLLVWYIRKLLSKFWSDVEVRDKFTEMINAYAESLENLYQLEELHGEESIKKAIEETRFVHEACKEYKKILQQEGRQEAGSQEEDGEVGGQETGQEGNEDGDEEGDQEEAGQKGGPIYLREGEKVTQEAGNYRRVIPQGR
jgi:hypothetical protein